MYARIKKSGPRQYLQLVEGHRDGAGKVKQRVVATLGRIDQLQDGSLDALIGGLQKAAGASAAAGSSDQKAERASPRFCQALAHGHVHALHQLWVSLGFDAALRQALRSSRRQFDAAALVRVMVFNRLCDADSKLGVLRWLKTVALPQAPGSVSHNQLLRTLDALEAHAGAVETAIADRLRPLMDDTLSVVFYDLTTVRIHGTADLDEDLRAYGLNKRTGGIARQFVLGVVQTAEGLPIAHQVHTGNTSEVSTLLPMIEHTLQCYPIKRVVLIADRGLLSLDNLEAIEALRTAQGEPLEYVLAVPGRRYGEFAETVADIERNFRVLKDDIAFGPVYHRLPERIRAHARICFLALVVYRVLRQRLKAHDAACSPETALKMLEAIQQHQVRMGRETLAGINEPDAEQRKLFASLGVRVPASR